MTPIRLPVDVEAQVSLAPYTTLHAGGAAEWLARAKSADELAEIAEIAHQGGLPMTVLGSGSNVLPSDRGVPGLVVVNQARKIEVRRGGELAAESGCALQDLFLKAAQAGLSGLEFAVGIPGTLGGALVSNAGAYRSCISEFLTELEVVYEGHRQWVRPEFMKFSYRDSILRRAEPPALVVLSVRMRMPMGDRKVIYDEARDYQRQRIAKQPPSASAGSFFKNINDAELAARIENLPEGMKKAGVVPAGYLIEHVGLKGYRQGGAMFGERHANFILNVSGATASEIRALAQFGKAKVKERFHVELEEEVLYLGDWRA